MKIEHRPSSCLLSFIFSVIPLLSQCLLWSLGLPSCISLVTQLKMCANPLRSQETGLLSPRSFERMLSRHRHMQHAHEEHLVAFGSVLSLLFAFANLSQSISLDDRMNAHSL